MNYIYHRVPNDFIGDTLYPLNFLKTIYPQVYVKEFGKYEGREYVPQQHISIFDNALWNDVLFFVAVDPYDIYQARRDAGWLDMKPQRYFKIDPSELNQSKLGIFLFPTTADPKNYTSDNFKAYDYDELTDYTNIPNATKQYFKDEFDAGEPYIKLFYRYIPHILYHGEIDVSNAEIIMVR